MWRHTTSVPGLGVESSPGAGGQPGLHSRFWASQGYVTTPCLKEAKAKQDQTDKHKGGECWEEMPDVDLQLAQTYTREQN